MKMKRINLGANNTRDGLDNLPEFAEEDPATCFEESKQVEEPTQEEDSNRLEYGLNIVKNMNVDERNSHIRKCIEMSLENKITQKNAFALQLIDCLSLLTEEKQDFPKMACTLDAGTKIYSHRVDALHQQVVKLAEEMILNVKQTKVNSKEENANAENGDGVLSKDKKHSKKKNVIVSAESLRRKFKGKDPRSKFVTFTGVPGSVTNNVRRDPEDLSYTLENNVPFWKNWDNYTPYKVGGYVKLPINIKIVREKMTQPNEEIDACAEDDNLCEPLDVEEPMLSPNVSSEFSSRVSETAVDVNDDLSSKSDEGNKDLDVVETVMKRMSLNSETQESSEKRFEALKILFKNADEYNHLDIKTAHFWAGPDFWKKTQTRTGGVQERKKTVRKKKDCDFIDFTQSTDEVGTKWSSLFSAKKMLSRKTICTWRKNKLLLPNDLKIDVKLFFQLFHMSGFKGQDVTLSKNIIDTVDKDSGFSNFAHDSSGGSDNMEPDNDSVHESIPDQPAITEDLFSKNFIHSEDVISINKNLGRAIGVEVSMNKNDSFDEYASLVPAPKMVSFEPIKYSIRPIQVDMQRLKETMMLIITEEIEKDNCVNSAAEKPGTRFSNVLKLLPTKLDQRTVETLSVAMSFMALLTITNENNLELEDTGNNDIIIRLQNNND